MTPIAKVVTAHASFMPSAIRWYYRSATSCRSRPARRIRNNTEQIAGVGQFRFAPISGSAALTQMQPGLITCALRPLFARERHVLVWRRVAVAGDQAEPRLADPGADAVGEGLAPKRGGDPAVVDAPPGRSSPSPSSLSRASLSGSLP